MKRKTCVLLSLLPQLLCIYSIIIASPENIFFVCFNVIGSAVRAGHYIFFIINVGVWGQLTCISTNLTGPEVNDHVSLQ
jgi:hypothetical protein